MGAFHFAAHQGIDSIAGAAPLSDSVGLVEQHETWLRHL
jgi:hypothetical protein